MSPRVLVFLCVVAAGVGYQSGGWLRRGFSGQTRGAGDPQKQMGSASDRGDAAEAVVPAGNGEAAGKALAAGRRRIQSLQDESLFSGAHSPADRKLAFLEALNAMPPDALADLVAKEAESSNFFRTVHPDFKHAAARLSEVAPEKAAALWLKHKGALLGGADLLLPWARRSPEAFVSWSLSLPQDAQKAASGVFMELARSSPEQFQAMAGALAQTPAGVAGARGAVEGLSKQDGKQQDPAAALAYAKALPEGPMRSAAIAQTVRNYGTDRLNPASDPEVRDALAALSPLEARGMGQHFASSAEKLPQGSLRESAFAARISAEAQKDPRSAAKKVEALSGSADYPAAVRGFVDATSSKDPAAAVDWALSIGPQGGQRAAALERAATEYFRQKPDEARKWVANAPLSAEEYFLLTGFRR